MGVAQFIYISLMAMNLLLTANLHGKERTGKHNIFLTILATGITMWIMIAGGFFS